MNKPLIKIELLTKFSPEDAAAIKQLVTQLGPGFQLLKDKDIKEILSSTATHLFVAREPKTQKIVGMITLIVYRIPYVKKAYLDDVIVDKNFRGQKIGSQLMEKALAHAKKLGAAFIDLTSHPTREEANKLYKKFGFKKRNTNVYRLTL